MLNLMRNINPTQDYISEQVTLDNGMIVRRYGICATNFVDYDVWEPTKIMGAHSTLTTFEGKAGWYGSITSRPLPAELEALRPGSDERCNAVRAFFAYNEQLVEAIIKSTFPQDFK